VEQTASCILLDFKSVDVLINNAGANFVKGSLEEHTLQLYQKTMDTNMMSYFLFAKFFIPNMVKHETGCVINIASTMGLRGAQDHLAYTISKGANITFTQSLALDYASCGIRINAIAPGLIDTPATEDWIKSQEDPGKAKGVPLGRAGTSEEIAHAAVFLASEEASYITGTVLVVDGGLSVGE
jgi:NAD(P)-dependent dehydrogenase (short-subunit alcohol dehydrogenase family)